MLSSYRPLAWFWGGVAWVLVVGGSTLQLLGPPSYAPQGTPAPVSAAPPPPVPAPPTPAPSGVASVGQVAPAAVVPAAPAPPPIPAPEAVETATIPTAPILSQPSRERPRSVVRRTPAPIKGPRMRGDGEDAAFSERGPLLPGAEPAIPARHEPAPGFDHSSGYIGVFATGADGTRTFKAMP